MVVQFHDGRQIAAPVTVVRSAENGDDGVIMAPIEAFHDELVGAGDEREGVGVIPRFGHVLAEGVAGAARRHAETRPVIGIRPQQIAHGALVRHLANAVHTSYLVDGGDGRTESAVETKDQVVDERRQRQIIEKIHKQLPYFHVSVLGETFVVESVHLRDLARFVISSEDGDALGITDFERDEQTHAFHRVQTPIHVVTHKDEVGGRRFSRDGKKFQQVVELTVDVTANCHRCFTGWTFSSLIRMSFAIAQSFFISSSSNFIFLNNFSIQESICGGPRSRPILVHFQLLCCVGFLKLSCF